MKRIIFYHDDNDGLMSAAVFHHATLCLEIMPAENTYVAVNYGKIGWCDHFKACQYDEIVFLDFCPESDILMELVKHCNKFTMLDHHETSKKRIEGVQFPLGSEVVIDTTHAACHLVWEYYFHNKRIPEAVRLVEDHDLWRHQYDNTKAFNINLQTEQITDPAHLAGYFSDGAFSIVHKDVQRGEAILAYREYLCQDLLKGVRYTMWSATIEGGTLKEFEYAKVGDTGEKILVGMTHCPYPLVNTLSQLILDTLPDVKIVLCFHHDGDYIINNVRSCDTSPVSARMLAEFHGGGGHKNAAGWTLERENDFDKK